MKKGEDYTGVAAVFFCHDGEGNYFLGKRGLNARDEQGRWDPGGGGVEFGDSIEETLRREIKEEYLADIIDIEFLGYRDVLRDNAGKQRHWVSLDFKVRIDPTTAGNGEPHKIDEVGWFRIDALPEPLHSQMPYFLRKYAGRF